MVLYRCFYAVRSLYVQGPDSDAWTGAVSLSRDGGTNYLSLQCITGIEGTRGCTVENSNIEAITVDSDNSQGLTPQAKYACFAGELCMLDVPTVIECVKVTTGAAGNNEGYLLSLKITHQYGQEIVTSFYSKVAYKVVKCFLRGYRY